MRGRGRRFAALFAGLLMLGGLGGCAGFGAWLPPHCPVELVASDTLPADLWLRAKLRFAIDEESVALEAIAQNGPDGLALVGIAPYGASLFALEQRGRDVHIESAATREHRYLAHFTLDALHRIYWIPAPEGGGAETGKNAGGSWAWGDERVAEESLAGTRRRTFTRGHETVTIEYPGPTGNGGIRIENPWCGYSAVVVTLDAAPPPPRDRAGSSEGSSADSSTE